VHVSRLDSIVAARIVVCPKHKIIRRSSNDLPSLELGVGTTSIGSLGRVGVGWRIVRRNAFHRSPGFCAEASQSRAEEELYADGRSNKLKKSKTQRERGRRCVAREFL
jgi:hypothetical protein